MEPATEAPADFTLEDTVLMQDDINLKELGKKPLEFAVVPFRLLLTLALLFRLTVEAFFII